MNRVKAIVASALLVSLGTLSGSALAYHGGYYGGHHGGARVGVYLGVPVVGFGYPYYGYPYGYGRYGGYDSYGGYGGYRGYGYFGPSTTVVTVQASPPVYVEQATAGVSGPASDGNWYYCNNPDGYYPYVKQCTAGWQRVPAQPFVR